MKRFKSILCVLLAAALLFSVLPMTALAAEADTADTGAAALGELGFIADYADLTGAPYVIRSVSTADSLKAELERDNTDSISIITLTADITGYLGIQGNHSDDNFIRYWVNVGKGQKILVLNGHTIDLINDYVVIYNHYGQAEDTIYQWNRETLFNIPVGAELNVIGMNKKGNYSTVRYGGTVLYKCDAIDNRDIFEVNGGSLTVNGGYYRINPTGTYSINDPETGFRNYYTVHGSSLTVNGGSLTVNSGSFEGRGYRGYHATGNDWVWYRNGALEIEAQSGEASVVINDGEFIGSSKANAAYIPKADLFTSQSVVINAAVFEMDQNDTFLATNYQKVSWGSYKPGVLGVNFDRKTLNRNANYYAYNSSTPIHVSIDDIPDPFRMTGYQFFAVNPKKGYYEFSDLPNTPTENIEHYRDDTFVPNNNTIGTWNMEDSCRLNLDSDDLYFPVVSYMDESVEDDGFGYGPNSMTALVTLTDKGGNDRIYGQDMPVYFDRSTKQYYIDLVDLLTLQRNHEWAFTVGESYTVKLSYTETYKGNKTYNIKHEGGFSFTYGDVITSISVNVAQPKPGIMASTATVSQGAHFKSEIQWRDVETWEIVSKFEANRQYVAILKFTPDSGYEFAYDATIRVNGNQVPAVVDGIYSKECRVYFDTSETELVYFAKADFASPLSVGSSFPTTVISGAPDKYEAAVTSWWIMKDGKKDEKINKYHQVQNDITYRVYVQLTPKKGYQFASDAGKATIVRIDGKFAKRSAGLYYVDYTFESEYNAASCTVTEPHAGEIPVYSVTVPDGASYTAQVVKWTTNDLDYEVKGKSKFAMNSPYNVFVRFVDASENKHLSEDADVTINGKKATRYEQDVYYTTLTTTGTWYLDKAEVNVTVPIAGNTPSYTVVGDEDYLDCKVIRWIERSTNHTMYDNDTFKAGEKYSCYVRFTPKEGFEFGDQTEFYINDVKAQKSGNTSGYLYYSILDAEGEVEVIDSVSASITEPVNGAHRDLSPVPEDDTKYTVNAADWWYNVTDDKYMKSPQDTFEAGKRYRTLLTFKSLPGYTFPGGDTTVIINGETITGEFVTADDKTVAVYVEYTAKESAYIIGDVNQDGKVDVTDATYVQMAVAELIELNAAQALAADANGDGKVDITDATYIQMYVAEIVDHLG